MNTLPTGRHDYLRILYPSGGWHPFWLQTYQIHLLSLHISVLYTLYSRICIISEGFTVKDKWNCLTVLCLSLLPLLCFCVQSAEEKVPVWYIMDEFGSQVQHSDQPSCSMAPFFYIQGQLAYSVLWPLQDLQEGGENKMRPHTTARYQKVKVSLCAAELHHPNTPACHTVAPTRSTFTHTVLLPDILEYQECINSTQKVVPNKWKEK